MQSLKHLTTRCIARVMTVALGLLALGGMATAPALAATATSNLSVTATVTATCLIATLPMAFGVYDPVSGQPSDGTGTVTVTCTSGSSATITLGQGSNAASGSTDAVPLRRMTDGASNFLSYFLYQNTARTTVWGNTSGTSIAHTGTGLPVAITIFGRIPASQNVPAALLYSDTVVATVTF